MVLPPVSVTWVRETGVRGGSERYERIVDQLRGGEAMAGTEAMVETEAMVGTEVMAGTEAVGEALDELPSLLPGSFPTYSEYEHGCAQAFPPRAVVVGARNV